MPHSRQILTSGPIPTFACHCGGHFCECWNQRTTSNIDTSGALDLTFALRIRSTNVANVKSAPLGNYRFENWNDLRALARLYFLRSTVRESRVRKPPFFSTPRSSGSKLVSALEMP